MIWELVCLLSGQVRAVPGAVIGFDMVAALAMADAIGIPAIAVAEFLPHIEVEMVQKLNAQAENG